MSNRAVYHLKYGSFLIEEREQVIIGVRRMDSDMRQDHSASSLTDLAASQLAEYFDGKRTVFDFPYRLEGTSFQKKVWDALYTIPYGDTRTYGEIAKQIGNPNAARAVGSANHHNPMQIIVPCHRVIGANGAAIGYAGGILIQKELLRLEQEVIIERSGICEL